MLMACPGRLLSQTLLSPLWMCKVRVQSRLLVAACTRALQPIIPTASWMCTHAHSSTCACPSGRHQCMATRLTGLSRSAHAARTTRERWCQVESASQSAAAPRSGCAAPTAPRGPPARPRPPPGAPPDAAARAAPARSRPGACAHPARRLGAAQQTRSCGRSLPVGANTGVPEGVRRCCRGRLHLHCRVLAKASNLCDWRSGAACRLAGLCQGCQR